MAQHKWDWEELWASENAPQNHEIAPIKGLAERATRAVIWGHMRFLAQNREEGDHTPYMRRVTGEMPEDTRPIEHSHSITGLSIEHHGLYWEVIEWSREFSSSYSARGRGRTLQEALADLAFER